MEPPTKRRRLEELDEAVETTSQIQALLGKMVPTEADPATNAADEIVTGYMLFLKLKSHNQKLREATEKRMDQAKEASARLNKQILTLQNLQYEKNHYMRGIEACKNFGQKDLSTIELISENQFLVEAPPDLVSDHTDPHELMLKRLQYENIQRISLQEKLKELCVRHQLITADNSKRQLFLDSLQNKVLNFSTSALQIKDSLQLPSITTQHNINTSLSQPLYALYSHLVVFQTFEPSSTVKIVGDPTASVDTDDFSAHPLSLEWIILCPDPKGPITTTLNIRHLVNLNVVTVEVSASLDTSIGADHLLIGIVQDDLGKTWPELAVKPQHFDDCFPTHKGRVYRWLQQLCGLDRLSSQNVSHRRLFDTIVTNIKYRVLAERTLQTQFDLLSRGKIAVDIKTKLPIRNFAAISEFNEISYSEWTAARHPEDKKTAPQQQPEPQTPDIGRSTDVVMNEVASPESQNVAVPTEGPEPPKDDREEGEIEMNLDGPVIGVAEPPKDKQSQDDVVMNEPASGPDDHEAGSRYFKMLIKCDKEEFKALLMISPCYPQIAPVFILSTKEKKPKNGVPTTLQNFTDPQAAAFFTQTAEAKLSANKNYNHNLQLIQQQINFNYLSFLPVPASQESELYLLSYQIRKLKMCLDVAYELGKKGTECSVGKMLGRVNRGRDRHMAFDHGVW